MRGKLLPFIAPLALAVLSLIAAGCNSGSNNNVPVIPCTLPSGTTVSMVYPIPGATLVPDNLSYVITASNVALPSSWQVVLLPPYGICSTWRRADHDIAVSAADAERRTDPPTPRRRPSCCRRVLSRRLCSPRRPRIQVGLNNTASSCNSYPIIGTFTSQ